MIVNPELQRIRTGEATPEEARAAIRKLLASGDAETSAALYTALRAWTWRALQMRRADEDLEAWFKVLKGTGAALARRDQITSRWVEALSHLVEDSVRYAITHSFDQLLTRSHVGEILRAVQLNSGRVSRDRLADTAGLSDSRLSQVLGELVGAGALEREMESRRATFVLTDVGRDLLERWTAARKRVESPVDPETEEVFRNLDWIATTPLKLHRLQPDCTEVRRKAYAPSIYKFDFKEKYPVAALPTADVPPVAYAVKGSVAPLGGAEPDELFNPGHMRPLDYADGVREYA